MYNCWRYIWPSPNSALGIIFVPLAYMTGGRACWHTGVLEVHGPAVAWFLARMPLVGGAMAMTLGHVVIGRDSDCLARSRVHERVHVRQYERYGPFFLPAYLAFTIVAWLNGMRPYRDNQLEVEAYSVSDEGEQG